MIYDIGKIEILFSNLEVRQYEKDAGEGGPVAQKRRLLLHH